MGAVPGKEGEAAQLSPATSAGAAACRADACRAGDLCRVVRLVARERASVHGDRAVQLGRGPTPGSWLGCAGSENSCQVAPMSGNGAPVLACALDCASGGADVLRGSWGAVSGL